MPGVIAPGVTKAGIRKIESGMREEQVIALIGPPLSRVEPYTGGTICGADGCEPAAPPRTQLVYAEGGPRLWVYLAHGKVDEVYGKYDPDEGCYGLLGSTRWESKAFENAFPR